MIVTARYSQIWIRNCGQCGRLFVARHPLHLSCGPECSRKRANSSDDYHRWKKGKRRTVTKDSDITPQQEAEMRKRARKCSLCKTFMTARPMLPNSKELDHIVPVGVGGTHTHGNVRIICRTCNLKRPKDGSDYYGQTTLWAMAPGVSIAAKPRPPQPRPKPPPKYVGVCECGGGIRGGRRQATRCHGCLVFLGQEAGRLRASGMKWREIAEKLDYPSVGGLFGLVRKYSDAS